MKQLENNSVPRPEIPWNNLVLLERWYLVAAYAYYVRDDPIISDADFDDIAKKLLACWKQGWRPKITKRGKKRALCLNKSDLEAGTCLLKPKEYQHRTVGAAEHAIYYWVKPV